MHLGMHNLGFYCKHDSCLLRSLVAEQSDRMYTDIGYTFVMLQALLKYVEIVQKIVYAPGSVKVVFKGSEKTALVGKFALAPPIAILTKFFGKRKLSVSNLTYKVQTNGPVSSNLNFL